MQCRICLEGPRSGNPLRRRCKCADAFHDDCLVSWIRSKGDARACCEVCGEPFKGVVREEQLVELRPGTYAAYAVGAGNWLISVAVLTALFPMPDAPIDCGAHQHTALTVCQRLDLGVWWTVRLVYWWAAFLWARHSYRMQLRRLPASWGASVRYSMLRLRPGDPTPAGRLARLRATCTGLAMVALHIARAARVEMATREAVAGQRRRDMLRRRYHGMPPSAVDGESFLS